MRHGFLLIRKSCGPTSHDVVAALRRALGERHIGHLGTLDPQAEGLVVLAVGSKALKVIELFSNMEKEYEATVRFGAVSTTYDAVGTTEAVPERKGWEPPTLENVRSILHDRFLGAVSQVPPAFSAVHVGGERAYRKAMQGRAVLPPERMVQIHTCDIVSYAYPLLQLKIRCGSGTYIRSIAHDLGTILRCGGYLQSLERTAVGAWVLGDAVTVERAAWGHVLPLRDILKNRPSVHLTDAQAEDVRCGRDVALEVQLNTIAWHAGLPIALLAPRKDGSRRAHPRKVL
jgi:tRNA pseudouridine55 synthase